MTTERIIFAIAGLLVASLTLWLGLRHFYPEERGCARSIALCKPADSTKAAADCRTLLDDVHHRLGGSIERMTAQCMLDSETCNESLSCVAHADRRANELRPHSSP